MQCSLELVQEKPLGVVSHCTDRRDLTPTDLLLLGCPLCPTSPVMAREEDSLHILMGNLLLKSLKPHKQSVRSFFKRKRIVFSIPPQRKCWLQQSINRNDCRCLSFLLKLKSFMLTPNSVIFHHKYCLSNPELFYLSVSQ